MLAPKKAQKDCIVDAKTPAEKVVEKIAKHGSVLCKGALSPDDLAPLRDNAERFFGHIEFCALNKLETPVTEAFNVTTLRMAASVLCLNARSRPVRLPLLDLLQKSYVHPILQSFLANERAMFLYHFSRVRKVYPEDHTLGKLVKSCFPYHQDGIPIGNYKQAMLCWIPLVPCGKDAPGLEVALKPMDELIPLANRKNSDFKDFEISDASVDKALGDAPRWQPDYELGDLQLIPSTTLHRTTPLDGMTQTSIAAELRFATPDDSKAFPREQRRILV